MNQMKACLPFIRPTGGDEFGLRGDLGAAGALGIAAAATCPGRLLLRWRRRHRRVAALVAPADAEVPRRHSRGVHVVEVVAAVAAIDLIVRWESGSLSSLCQKCLGVFFSPPKTAMNDVSTIENLVQL